MKRITTACSLLALLLVNAWVSPAPLRASTLYTVDSTLDEIDALPGDGLCFSTPSGQCTLRAAVMEVNAWAGTDTIVVPDGLYLLTISGQDDTAETGDLDINANMTILGAGSASTIVDGNNLDKVFHVAGGISTTISSLTMRHGSAGGIYTENGTITIVNSAIVSNTSSYGGGVRVTTGILNLINSVVSNNSATIRGGGVVFSGSTVTIVDSTISNNTAAEGGGLYTGYGTITVLNSSIDGNHATEPVYGRGGGIIHTGGSLTLINSSVSNNTSIKGGGGIYNLSYMTLANSTIASNTTIGNGGGIENHASGSVITLTNVTLSGNIATDYGGGISVYTSQASFNNVTVVGNTADSDGNDVGNGGGIDLSSPISAIIKNSILADNIDNSPTTRYPECSGFMTSQDYNFIRNSAGCFLTGLVAHNKIGLNPNLGPLQDNGGPTLTSALLAGSPAIDAGNPAGCADAGGNILSTDQRNFLSPVDGEGNGSVICDMGAYEFGAQAPGADLGVTQTDLPDPLLLGNTLTYTVIVANAGPLEATGVVLTDTLPLSLTLGLVTPSQGSCAGTSEVVCALGDLASNSAVTITLAVTPTVTGLLNNMVLVTGNEFDPTLPNVDAETTAVADILYTVYLPLIRR